MGENLEALCKKFAFELVSLMEAKIIQISAEQEKEIKKINLARTPNKTSTTKVTSEGIIYIKGHLLFRMWQKIWKMGC